MDDNLVCGENSTNVDCVLKKNIGAIESAGFKIREDKIQLSAVKIRLYQV